MVAGKIAKMEVGTAKEIVIGKTTNARTRMGRETMKWMQRKTSPSIYLTGPRRTESACFCAEALDCEADAGCPHASSLPY